jgi:hypothetical protein
LTVVEPAFRRAVGSPLRSRWTPALLHSRRTPVLLALGALAAVGATHLIDFGVYHLHYRIFDANSAASWSHLLDAGLLAAGAVVCIAGSRRQPAQRATWIATAAILALFFLDEASGLHAAIGTPRFGKLLYAPILAVLVYCVWRLTRRGEHFAVVQASAALLLSSYVIHVLDPHNIARALGWTVEGWAFQVVVAIKEGTELAGVLLALLALCGTAVVGFRTTAMSSGRPRPPAKQ